MTVYTASLYEALTTLPDSSTLLLHEVSWEEYEALLERLPDHPRFRLTYDQGTLQIMTPSPQHERLKALFAHVLATLADELQHNLVGLGSTTFKHGTSTRGLEPDDCYYIQHADRMAGRERLDPGTDPPPDLVIEVDMTHPSLDKLPLYASLGVPEVWRHDGRRLHIMGLRQGQYVAMTQSAAFPLLTADTLTDFLQQGRQYGIVPMIRAFRVWIRAQDQPARRPPA